MNRIGMFVVFLNALASIANAFGFASITVPSRMSIPRTVKCFNLNMQFESRRDILRKPVQALKLSSVLASSLPFLAPAIARASQAEYDDTWTKHNGAFPEEWLNDFQKTSSGLLYKDIEVGKGASPNDGDAVSIHMVGYIYETGEKWTNTYKGIPTFQSTVRAGTRPNQKFMKGLNEGVLTMKRGGRRILVIPAYLAYNYTTILAENNPNAPIIPGGSSLVCYVEVLDFKPLPVK